jgi:Condensation domain/Phosphopantetheine attachment site
LRTGETTHRLILSTHQLLVDGWSLPRIVADLAASYSGGSGTARPAGAYREYVKWLQQDDEAGEVFWRRLLSGVKEPTPAPFVADASAQERQSPGEVVRSLTRLTTEAIRAAGRQHQVDVGALISAAWGVVLAHRSGRSDVVFGASFGHRPNGIPGIETMVGPCVNNLPIRILVDAHEPIAPWLRHLQQLVSEISRYQTTPLASLQKCSDIPAWSRMFDSLLVIQDDAVNSCALTVDGVRLGLVRWTGSTGYPATVMVRFSEQLEIRVIGSGDGFGVASAGAAADDLVSVLQHLTEIAGGSVGDLLSCLPSTSEGAASGSAEPRRRRGARLVARTDMERTLVRIWAELFGEEIGTDENYFKLGAHSLMIVRLHERIGSTIDAGLPISALFESPTIRALAAYLESRAVPGRPADKIRSYRPSIDGGAERPRMEAGAKGRRS